MPSRHVSSKHCDQILIYELQQDTQCNKMYFKIKLNEAGHSESNSTTGEARAT